MEESILLGLACALIVLVLSRVTRKPRPPQIIIGKKRIRRLKP